MWPFPSENAYLESATRRATATAPKNTNSTRRGQFPTVSAWNSLQTEKATPTISDSHPTTYHHQDSERSRSSRFCKSLSDFSMYSAALNSTRRCCSWGFQRANKSSRGGLAMPPPPMPASADVTVARDPSEKVNFFFSSRGGAACEATDGEATSSCALARAFASATSCSR